MTDPTTRVRAILDAATMRLPLTTNGPDSVGGNNIYDVEWVVAYAQSYDKPTTIGCEVKPETYLSFDQAGLNAAAIVLSCNLLPAALDVVEAARAGHDWCDYADCPVCAALDAYDAKVQETLGS